MLTPAFAPQRSVFRYMLCVPIKLMLHSYVHILITSLPEFPLHEWTLDMDTGRVVIVAGGIPGVNPDSDVQCTEFTIVSGQ